MYETLSDFVVALERAGELRRVQARVSPVLEIAAVADRVSRQSARHRPSAAAQRTDPQHHGLGGCAMLFENVEGSDLPVLINAWGSYRRIEMALGCNEAGPGLDAGHTPGGLEALAAKIGSLVKPQPPRSLNELMKKAGELLPLLRIPPKRKRGRGACQEIEWTGDRADITRLPLLRCWPLDGDLAAVGYPSNVNDSVQGLGRGEDWDRSWRGRYITLGGIHTIHADDEGQERPESHNIGMYRVQALGKHRMAMHWHMHHDGARHWRSWKAKGKPMPVAIALGGESVMPYAATAPLPPGISELLLAGFLNRSGIELVKGRTVPLWVPANAEIVIEGYVSHEAGLIGFDPRRDGDIGPGAVFEGPFGDHTGFYSMPDRYPILDVTAITMRRDAIYPTTIVGLPPQEDYYLGKATERLFLPLLRTLVHDIEDYDLPMFGAFHNCAFVKIKKAYPLQARRVMHSIWGAGQMAWTKTIFVVDHDVNVHDAAAVLRAASERCEVPRDIELANGPLDILDHAAPRLGVGVKAGFDCTRKLPDERIDGATEDQKPANPSTQDKADAIAAATSVQGVATAAIAESCGDGWMFIGVTKSPGRGGMEIARGIADAMRTLRWRPRFAVVVSQNVRVTDSDESLFHWLANSDAGRDWKTIDGVLWCDATPKTEAEGTQTQPVRPWPPIISMPDDVKTRVTARWAEYGFAEASKA